jgi:hypothetical protein
MNKQALILIFVLFTAPVVIATVMHSEWISWKPGGTRNHGELIQPVIALPAFSLTDGRGEILRKEDLLDRWHLVHLRSDPCDQACLEDLYWLRQVRRAQDRHQPEVGLLLVSSVELDSATLEQIYALAEDFTVVHGQAAEPLLRVFPDSEESQFGYITDPMANIILGYPADADPNGMRRDLRRLLTWTQRE